MIASTGKRVVCTNCGSTDVEFHGFQADLLWEGNGYELYRCVDCNTALAVGVIDSSPSEFPEHQEVLNDEPSEQKLYSKYEIRKAGTGELVEGFAFVLRIGDWHARVALLAYAASLREEDPDSQLATEIVAQVNDWYSQFDLPEAKG